MIHHLVHRHWNWNWFGNGDPDVFLYDHWDILLDGYGDFFLHLVGNWFLHGDRDRPDDWHCYWLWHLHLDRVRLGHWYGYRFRDWDWHLVGNWYRYVLVHWDFHWFLDFDGVTSVIPVVFVTGVDRRQDKAEYRQAVLEMRDVEIRKLGLQLQRQKIKCKHWQRKTQPCVRNYNC